jgi:hypothetical protein
MIQFVWAKHFCALEIHRQLGVCGVGRDGEYYMSENGRDISKIVERAPIMMIAPFGLM